MEHTLALSDQQLTIYITKGCNSVRRGSRVLFLRRALCMGALPCV